MGFQRYASFTVLASAIADATGTLPADVLRVGGSGTAFTKNAHRHNFVYDPKPGYLYVRSRAISSRTNDNYDTFPAHSIKEAWHTFVGKPVFVNHHNETHKRARGVIIDAALHEDTSPGGAADTWVEVLMEVDAVRFPKLAEAVVKGHIDRTSMGTEVALSTCSYCGNTAANPAEYCRHIPAMKGQRITRTTASGSKESVLISEICEGLSFFENSLLVEAPADPTAYTFGVDTRGLSGDPTTARMAKAASLQAVAVEDAGPLTDFEVIEAESILAIADWDLGSDDDEYHFLEVPDVGEATVTMEVAGNPTAATGKWEYDAYRYDDLPTRLRGSASSLAEAKATCEQYINGGQMSLFSSKTASSPDFVICPRCGKKITREQYLADGGGTDCSQIVNGEHTGHSFDLSVINDWTGSNYPDGRSEGDWDGWQTEGSRRTALGEQTAPAEVDTLRVEACPVCGDADSFNGTKCNVCGFIKPPDLFDDPDLERAKKVDLRGGDASEDGTDTPTSELECDSCGATFPLAKAASPSSTNSPTNGPGMVSTSALPGAIPKPKLNAPDKPNPFAKKDKKKPDPNDPNADPEQVDPNADPAKVDPEEKDPNQPPDPDEPVDTGADNPEVPPADPADPAAAEPSTDQPLAAGDTCPTCDQGTLNEIAISTEPEVAPPSGAQGGDLMNDPATDAPHVDPSADPNDPNAKDPNADPGVGKMDPNQPTDPKDEAAVPDQKDPAADPEADPEAAPDDADPKAVPDDADPKDESEDDDKDSGGKKKNLPPWMKKKTSHRAGTSLKGKVDDMANPAQANRNRLIVALRAQQSQITAQSNENRALRTALLTLATAAGVAGHPHFAALRRIAGGDPNGPMPSEDMSVRAPAADDDPTNIGAAPSSANTGVTPAATTDVSNTNVALPAGPFGDMVDVTQAGTDIEVPKGDAAHVETDVQVGTPSDKPFPDNSGWTASREDPQVRLMSSLRLARMRKAAGVGGDVEEMSLGQAISDDHTMTLAIIQHEIKTLSAVASAKAAPSARTAAARSLVPQRAAGVQRTVPSLSTTAGASNGTGTEGTVLADSLF